MKKVLGDYHDGVATELIELDNDIVIHKPRPATIEKAFNAFLLTLEEKGFFYIPGYVKIISDNDNSQYVKCVKHTPAYSEHDIHMYHRRCGVILFLAYLFSSTDLHRNNIIANGEYPVIVDYETLLTGDTDRDTEISQKFATKYSDSVFASYLLPRWVRAGNHDIDNSGFSGHRITKEGDVGFFENKNVLFYSGKAIETWKYVDDIIEGFSYAYDFARDNQSLFEKAIYNFRNCYFRFILRPTQLYLDLSKFLSDVPSGNRNGYAKMLLERAYVNDVDPNKKSRAQKLLYSEVHAVLNGEVPLFLVKGDETNLRTRREVVFDNYFILSPIDNALRKLNSLSNINKYGQIKIIKQTYEAATPLRYYKHQNIIEKYVLKGQLDRVEKKYIEGMSTGWLYLNRTTNGRLVYSEIGYGLYSGLLGILCFYASVYYTNKDTFLLQLIRDRYKLFQLYCKDKHFAKENTNLGLANGVGGYVNALCHLTELTGDQTYYQDAVCILNKLEVSELSNYTTCDVLNGYAGLAIAIGKIDSFDMKMELMSKKVAEVLEGYKPGLTGYGHGAAGVAYGLGVLGEKLNTNRFDSKIIELLNWENQFYDEEFCNWKDLRYSGKLFMHGWCSGSPGIIMSRYELMKRSTNIRIKKICLRDINRSKSAVYSRKEIMLDSLCCGNSAILMLASRLGESIDDKYITLINRLKKDKLFFTHMANTCDYIPGLMQGNAGVGYVIAMYGDSKCGNMLI